MLHQESCLEQALRRYEHGLAQLSSAHVWLLFYATRFILIPCFITAVLTIQSNKYRINNGLDHIRIGLPTTYRCLMGVIYQNDRMFVAQRSSFQITFFVPFYRVPSRTVIFTNFTSMHFRITTEYVVSSSQSMCRLTDINEPILSNNSEVECITLIHSYIIISIWWSPLFCSVGAHAYFFLHFLG